MKEGEEGDEGRRGGGVKGREEGGMKWVQKY